MKIVADRDIFRIHDYFAGFGELRLLPGREIGAADVADAEALLVRTVTRVDRALLANSRVKFVGSASSGFDHVDRDWLAGNDIRFFHAAGCNADAVVNYVFAALAWLSGQTVPARDWRRWSVGIIGAGNVGGRLARTLERLGMAFRVYDPLLTADHPLSPQFATLEEVLRQDVVSVHTPLTLAGPYPTRHMLDADALGLLGQGAVLINAARGEVVDNGVLAGFLGRRPDLRVVLDVWENEPDILPALLARVAVATPHIAGYSLNGKKNATAWVCDAFRAFFGLGEPTGYPATGVRKLTVPEAATDIELLNRLILAACPIGEDVIDRDYVSGKAGLGRWFDAHRNGYRFRPEFGDFCLDRSRLPDDLAADLAALGFNLDG